MTIRPAIILREDFAALGRTLVQLWATEPNGRRIHLIATVLVPWTHGGPDQEDARDGRTRLVGVARERGLAIGDGE